MNTLKRHRKKEEELFCDDNDINIEDLKICLESLNSYKKIFFGEYQLKQQSTFIETPEHIKKCAMNPQNDDIYCFKYSVALALYHKEIGRNPQRVSKIKPFINNTNGGNINFSPQEQDYEPLKMKNKSIALNIFQEKNTEQGKVSHLHKSKFNKTRETQVILLMITDNTIKHFKCFIKKSICLL